jgi:hypothetical protein
VKKLQSERTIRRWEKIRAIALAFIAVQTLVAVVGVRWFDWQFNISNLIPGALVGVGLGFYSWYMGEATYREHLADLRSREQDSE